MKVAMQALLRMEERVARLGAPGLSQQEAASNCTVSASVATREEVSEERLFCDRICRLALEKLRRLAAKARK